MKIFLAADHAGFELKKFLSNYLIQIGYNVEDTTSDLISQMKSEIAAGRPMLFAMSPMPQSLCDKGIETYMNDYWADSMYTCNKYI